MISVQTFGSRLVHALRDEVFVGPNFANALCGYKPRGIGWSLSESNVSCDRCSKRKTAIRRRTSAPKTGEWARQVDMDYLAYITVLQKYGEFLTAVSLASRKALTRFEKHHPGVLK